MTTDAPAVAAPTVERGRDYDGAIWWNNVEYEHVPELQWPLSVGVYDKMRRSDAQCASVLRAVTLPVRRTAWRIDPAGARPEIAAQIAQDLGLPLVGADIQPALRTRDSFSWSEHLRLALLMLPFGHMFFEQVARYDETAGIFRLRKLAPRLPRTITDIRTAEDGGLLSIQQRNADKLIPVSQLVAYIHDREGGNWLGQSLLRPAYKHWLLKDRMLRTQTASIDRTGMGVPLYTGAQGEVDLSAGQSIASQWRSGESAGAAIPFGAKMELVGISGRPGPDPEPAIRYHDEQIARAVLAHFLNLGTQTGSWALGSTFADFFVASLQTLAEQLRDVTQQHVIEDMVDWNYGSTEPAPRLIFEEIGSRQQATAASLKALVDAGVIYPDRLLEETVRQTLGLPAKDPATSTAPAPTGGAA